MKQPITGWHLDDENQWVAELGCGHGRHFRHQPPWSERSWVLTEPGRQQQLGTMIDCRKCDNEQAGWGPDSPDD
ncbi:MAG: DUF3565 domain-containing protein [Gammaproteobacteria bacterium]|nr:DUF3565 domain-containing protein [Gammaproteobacteria bacterium]